MRAVMSMDEAHFGNEARGPNAGIIMNATMFQEVAEEIGNTNNDRLTFQAPAWNGNLPLWREKLQLTPAGVFPSTMTENGGPANNFKVDSGISHSVCSNPPLVYPMSKDQFYTRVSREMSAVIYKMKNKGVLKVVQRSPSFVSPMFLVSKPDGSARQIFNQKALNGNVMSETFHLINMYRIPDFLQAQDWLCKIDLPKPIFI
ncbi:unnamed protein product [Arctia plantaginis]|uniref:Uncharacterized protein n=1 Tax=Arctia plantaginis TaxID=874455 RepID=A0A8S0ZLW8_ARCPL|nr:unnamed protein product [Arctia plantaginis]